LLARRRYLYLLLSEPADVPLDLERYVFTTEAHPLPVLPARTAPRTSADAASDTHVMRVASTGESATADAIIAPVYPPWWRDERMLDETFGEEVEPERV
jgi:hypothetical protein